MKKRLKAGRGEVTIDVPRSPGTVLIVEDWLKVRAKRTRSAIAPSDFPPDYLLEAMKERPEEFEELAEQFAMREWLDSLTKDDMPTQWFMTRSMPISIESRFGR